MQNTPLRAGPKPKNIVSVCIDEINEELVAGRMYHCYSESPRFIFQSAAADNGNGNVI